MGTQWSDPRGFQDQRHLLKTWVEGRLMTLVLLYHFLFFELSSSLLIVDTSGVKNATHEPETCYPETTQESE